VVKPRRLDPQPGWPQVVLVAVAVVVAVLGAAVLTGVLPDVVREAIYETPVAIVALIVGTGWLLWRISRQGPGPPDQ
jgi:undecaprenyl pyrophosphate phosphatase UppP